MNCQRKQPGRRKVIKSFFFKRLWGNAWLARSRHGCLQQNNWAELNWADLNGLCHAWAVQKRLYRNRKKNHTRSNFCLSCSQAVFWQLFGVHDTGKSFYFSLIMIQTPFNDPIGSKEGEGPLQHVKGAMLQKSLALPWQLLHTFAWEFLAHLFGYIPLFPGQDIFRWIINYVVMFHNTHK